MAPRSEIALPWRHEFFFRTPSMHARAAGGTTNRRVGSGSADWRATRQVGQSARGRRASQSVRDSTSRTADRVAYRWPRHFVEEPRLRRRTDRRIQKQTRCFRSVSDHPTHCREDVAKVPDYPAAAAARCPRRREGCPGAHRRDLRERARASREHTHHVLRTMVRERRLRRLSLLVALYHSFPLAFTICRSKLVAFALRQDIRDENWEVKKIATGSDQREMRSARKFEKLFIFVV